MTEYFILRSTAMGGGGYRIQYIYGMGTVYVRIITTIIQHDPYRS